MGRSYPAAAATSTLPPPAEQFDEILAVNLQGSTRLARAAMAVMRPASYGRIILVASTGGLHSYVGLSAYAASKGGLLAFVRSLAAEGAGKGVLANLLLQYALTQMTDDGMPPAARKHMKPDAVAPVLTAPASEGCRLNGQYIALVSSGLSAGSGDPGRRMLVLLLTVVCGLRLGAHIFARNRGRGEDMGYASLLRRNRGSLATFVLRYVYSAQGQVMWLVSPPVQVAMYETRPAGRRDVAGRGGMGGGDRLPDGRGCAAAPVRGRSGQRRRVLDRGLWRYTRHPNYFGDAVVWFGLRLLACSHWLGLLVVISPVCMTNMLVRQTGKKLLEKHMARSKGAAYANYVRRTSGFIPWPPR